ncbi:MAG: PfkB family carbohydrate kinase [Candidatus Competibacter sp.]
MPKTVLLGPICDEVSFDFLDFFAAQTTLTCACPQGWMRQWDENKKVSPKPIPDWLALAKADIISMSEADVAGDWDLINHIATIANILLVTQGVNGAVVFEKGQRRHFPSLPVEELDPTGAGDIFAAAFLLNYAEGKDLQKAVHFAHLAAGLSIQGSGMGSVPGRAEVGLT